MNKYKWRDQFKDIGNSSLFHKQIQEIFKTDPLLKNFKCYQEVNTKELIPSYSYHNHRFDWYIEELNLILELHGEHHYHISNYGNLEYEKTAQQFRNIKERDSTKMHAAISSGYKYLALSYKERKELTAEKLKELLLDVR